MEYVKQLNYLLSLGFNQISSTLNQDGDKGKIELRHPTTFNSITLIIRKGATALYSYNGFDNSPVGLYEPDFEKFTRKLAGKE